MKKKRLSIPLLLAFLLLFTGSSWAGEVSMNRVYRHTNLREVRRATVQVLENHRFDLVRRNPSRLTFVRKSGHDGKLVLSFTFRDKNKVVKLHVSGESRKGHGKHDDETLRKTTERLLEAIRHQIR